MTELKKLKRKLDTAMLRHLELDMLQDNIDTEQGEKWRADIIEELDGVETEITTLNRKIDKIENENN